MCQHWKLGPPASCTEWACGATKGTDPPKSIKGTTGDTGKKPKFPVVNGIGTGLKLQNSGTTGNSQSSFHKKDCVGTKKCF